MAAVDVVVVGGGLAGLAAARRLQAHGRRVVVLEARDVRPRMGSRRGRGGRGRADPSGPRAQRVGGRTHTVTHHGKTVDVGGQWIGPSQSRVNKLVREFGLTLLEQPVDGTHVRPAHAAPVAENHH
jgi:monoamine oxidase